MSGSRKFREKNAAPLITNPVSWSRANVMFDSLALFALDPVMSSFCAKKRLTTIKAICVPLSHPQ